MRFKEEEPQKNGGIIVIIIIMMIIKSKTALIMSIGKYGRQLKKSTIS